MFCSRCGEKIKEGNSFCIKCGNPVMPREINLQMKAGVWKHLFRRMKRKKEKR